MQFKITKIGSLRLTKTAFYTVRLEGQILSEAQDLLNRMVLNPKDNIEFIEITEWMKNWGNYEGAISDYFKREREADALNQPYEILVEDDSRDKDDYGLRWYCYRLNEQIVILFNGARKTTQAAQDCPNVRQHFYHAIELSKALDAAFGTGDLYIENYFDIKERNGFILKTI